MIIVISSALARGLKKRKGEPTSIPHAIERTTWSTMVFPVEWCAKRLSMENTMLPMKNPIDKLVTKVERLSAPLRVKKRTDKENAASEETRHQRAGLY